MPEQTVLIDGTATWVSREGAGGGETVLLLHGGLGDSRDLLDSIAPHLEEGHDVVAFDRRGHGRTPDSAGPFHYQTMADETVELMRQMGLATTHLIGWSDGGIVALLIALTYPQKVQRVVLVGTNFHHEALAEPDLSDESPVTAALRERYASVSPDGDDHFPSVLQKFLAMARSEPTLTTQDVANVTAPTLVLVGDDDLVSLQHTVDLFEALPSGQLAVIPGASHMAPVEKPELVSNLILEFLTGPVPPETYLPRRRA